MQHEFQGFPNKDHCSTNTMLTVAIAVAIHGPIRIPCLYLGFKLVELAIKLCEVG